MRYLLTLFTFIISFNAAEAQSLAVLVKKVNPQLFMNNMDNERVYQQANLSSELIMFTRDFHDKTSEDMQQIYYYRPLCKKNTKYLLEFKLDKREINLSALQMVTLKPIVYSDFGLKVYALDEESGQWSDATLDLLPEDFLETIEANLSDLQKGSEVYFYNLNMRHIVEIEYEKGFIKFMQDYKPILRLQWKRNRFIWK